MNLISYDPASISMCVDSAKGSDPKLALQGPRLDVEPNHLPVAELRRRIQLVKHPGIERLSSSIDISAFSPDPQGRFWATFREP